jgi:hypothetical protein
LVLDEGAREQIITPTANDPDNLHDLLEDTKTVFDDIDRRLFIFGLKRLGD